MLSKEKLYSIALVIAILIIGGLIFKSCEDAKVLRQVKVEESNLRKALTDTLTHFQTEQGTWGAQKLSLQTDIKNLKDDNLNLNTNQKRLLKEVERQNKTAETFAAALVQIEAKIGGYVNNTPTNQNDSTVQFSEKTPNFEYDLTVYNVKPFSFKTPTLTINKISLPNTQSINFHWRDDRKEGYPTAFSVINSNPYFKVSDIQSYVIPEIKKIELKPNLWQKIDKFGKSTGGKILIFGTGVIVGGIAIK